MTSMCFVAAASIVVVTLCSLHMTVTTVMVTNHKDSPLMTVTTTDAMRMRMMALMSMVDNCSMNHDGSRLYIVQSTSAEQECAED